MEQSWQFSPFSESTRTRTCSWEPRAIRLFVFLPAEGENVNIRNPFRWRVSGWGSGACFFLLHPADVDEVRTAGFSFGGGEPGFQPRLSGLERDGERGLRGAGGYGLGDVDVADFQAGKGSLDRPVHVVRPAAELELVLARPQNLDRPKTVPHQPGAHVFLVPGR